MKVFFSFLCLTFSIINSYAQDLGKMSIWQNSLHQLGVSMYGNEGEPERLEKNFQFVKTLVQALKEKNSYAYDFSTLDMISIIRSPDDKFRIFSWSFPLNDGSHLFYGAIQLKTSNGELHLIPLLDRTFDIAEPNTAIFTNNNWYGAQYYEIIPFQSSYLLLGLKRHSAELTQRIIEVINIAGDKVNFGAVIFSDQAQATRRIFSYSREVTMLLKGDLKNKRIVFDHLVSINPSAAEDYKYYGPDLSHDAYNISGSKLQLIEDIELQNSASDRDAQFLDPKRKAVEKKSGF